LSTISGIKEVSVEARALAAPYLEKCKNREGRKEIMAEVTELAAPYVESTKEYALNKAAPLVTSTKEYAAPYISKLESSRDAIVTSKRYEKAKTLSGVALTKIRQAREHPEEVVQELKATAVDLLKYDTLESYREYVLSPQFTADTLRLVQVELPAIAADATKRGAEKLQIHSEHLACEMTAKRDLLRSALRRGCDHASGLDLAELKLCFYDVIFELNRELNEDYALLKQGDFSPSDALSRIWSVLKPLEKVFNWSFEDTKAVAPLEGPMMNDASNDDVGDAPCVDTDEDNMHDALETSEDVQESELDVDCQEGDCCSHRSCD